ncbi:MAG: hypothetical protein K0Q49_178 [Haloplasmataceae bacterium]|jgi:hypothetical protein|nr:hypothetical protein [Haloplasmataceae bacterium]
MQIKRFKYWSDETKGNLLRVWAVGAVYFFIGWGTSFGQADSYLDSIFFLALGITLITILVVNPIIRGMLKTSLDKKYNETTVSSKVFNRLTIFFESLLIVILIVLTYQLINQILIVVLKLSEEVIVLPVEPFLFSLFYFIYYYLLNKIIFVFIKRKSNR